MTDITIILTVFTGPVIIYRLEQGIFVATP